MVSNIQLKTPELLQDIARLYELVCSSIQKESVEIKLSEFGIAGIPCVKAVNYDNVTADIDVVPQYDETENADNKNQQILCHIRHILQ